MVTWKGRSKNGSHQVRQGLISGSGVQSLSKDTGKPHENTNYLLFKYYQYHGLQTHLPEEALQDGARLASADHMPYLCEPMPWGQAVGVVRAREDRLKLDAVNCRHVDLSVRYCHSFLLSTMSHTSKSLH